MQPELWQPVPKHIQELQQWVRRPDSLIANKNQEVNRLEGAGNAVAVNINTHIEFQDKQIKEIEELISDHIKRHQDLNDKSKLLDSIPGVGEKTIAVVLAFLNVENFGFVKQVAAFVGLNPKPKQSGSSIRGTGRISKTGNADLRKAFYMPAILIITGIYQVQTNNTDEYEDYKPLKFKMQPGQYLFLELGGGYNINDISRIDLTYFATHPKSKRLTNYDWGSSSHRVDTKIQAFFLNGFIDIFNFSEYGKIFTGLGIGRSTVKLKHTINTALSGSLIMFLGKTQETTIIQYKKVNHISSAAYLGISGQFSPAITGEIIYSYRYYGNCKFTPVNPETNKVKLVFRGHHIAAGLRFNL